MSAVRGVRGATTVATDTAEEVVAATRELLEVLAEVNGFEPGELASIFFTVTPDLQSTFPARAARALGWTEVPMLCGREIAAASGLERCIRVLLHWNTGKSAAEVRHVYLREARLLRPDWAHPAPGLGEEEPPPKPKAAPAAGRRVEAGPARRPVAREEVVPIAFQGEPGAYSQEAIFKWLGDGTACAPCETFEDAAQAVLDGRANAALLPVENSTTGSIHPVYDVLLNVPLAIQAEVILPVRHVLMARPGTGLRGVKRVLSHPQALEQCRNWIASHRWEAVVSHDTAGAARLVSESDEPGLAAVASRTAAKLHGLEILAQDIQDVAANYTRFLLLAPGDLVRPEPQKTSLIFATRHVAGDLYQCLAQFAVREINLTKIESRPDRNTPWNYLFYLDFEGYPGQAKVDAALAGLERHVTFVRVAGSYASTELR